MENIEAARRDAGKIFHVTKFVLNGKPRIFRRDEARYLLRSVIIYYKAQHGFRVYGYCMLPDRVHLIIGVGSRVPLARIMKDIWGNYSRKVNARWKRKGAVLRSKYIKKELFAREDVRIALAKIHAAPTEQGLEVPASGTPVSSVLNYRKGLGDMLVDLYRVRDEIDWPIPTHTRAA